MICCDACNDTGCPACCDEAELRRLGLETVFVLDESPPEEDGCAWCGAALPVPGFDYCSDACEWDHFINDVAEDREYTIDGESVNLVAFDTDNGGLPADCRAAIMALQPGQEVILGGGTGARCFQMALPYGSVWVVTHWVPSPTFSLRREA